MAEGGSAPRPAGSPRSTCSLVMILELMGRGAFPQGFRRIPLAIR
ncbi:hypothetical protein SAMN06297129_0450 [Pseudooceanicola antarcticus]|uniref:Uncharacterized protein n=1 Tax=Pseudooceanicola antarcticus TaxID=1247613 RepID=A0A285HS29_9RHOB|nr:hypothetical protein SAMN06297129_0450 [Pseudooceanicola antarcticus]